MPAKSDVIAFPRQPAVNGGEAPAEAQTEVQAAGELSAPDGRETRALLVSKDPTTLRWAARYLAREQFATDSANSEEAALGYLADRMPDVAIIEAGLKASGGERLFQELQRQLNQDDVAVIALCANARETELAVEAGVTEIIRKPFDWNLLSKRAAHAARSLRTTAELAATKCALHDAETLIADARKHVSRLEHTDPLTGLPNTPKFRQLLESAVNQTGEVAVFFIGLERFHLINDALGYETGNQALQAFAKRLREMLVRPDLLRGGKGFLAAAAAKLGGVRFGLFLPYSGKSADLGRIRRVLTRETTKPLEVCGQTIYVPCSIGAAVSPADGGTAGSLLVSAERAMMSVKRRGGGFGFHRKDRHPSGARQFELDRMLRESIGTGDLRLAFQPIVSLSDHRVVGAEALLRWRHPEEGCVSPTEFIPIAERTGLMVSIGEHVVHTACVQLRDWLDRGLQPLNMAINVSLCQLHRSNLPGTLRRILKELDVPPHLIELELSERGAVGADPDLISELGRLKRIGVRLSLDDFGTGDAAIKYLKRLPIDVLKIDQSYVAGAIENEKDAAIASALVNLGRDMDLTVVAEGVELPEQCRLLQSWGCHYYQGFLYSPAVSGDEFFDLVSTKTQSAPFLGRRVATRG